MAWHNSSRFNRLFDHKQDESALGVPIRHLYSAGKHALQTSYKLAKACMRADEALVQAEFDTMTIPWLIGLAIKYQARAHWLAHRTSYRRSPWRVGSALSYTARPRSLAAQVGSSLPLRARKLSRPRARRSASARRARWSTSRRACRPARFQEAVLDIFKRAHWPARLSK